MVADSRTQGRRRALGITIGLALAAFLMILNGASVAGLALVGLPGGSIRIGADTVAALALGAWFAFAGVETLRRRHFAIAVLTPAAIALLDLGYVIVTGRAEAIGAVLMMLVVVLLVAGSRQAFRD